MTATTDEIALSDLEAWDLEEQIITERRNEIRKNLKKVLKELKRGKTPRSGIIDCTKPTDWLIRVDEDAYEDGSETCLTDKTSRKQLTLWLNRGGRSGPLFLTVPPGSCLIDHAVVRLVDASSGHSCVGISFQAYADGSVKRRDSTPGIERAKEEGKD